MQIGSNAGLAGGAGHGRVEDYRKLTCSVLVARSAQARTGPAEQRKIPGGSVAIKNNISIS